MVITQCSEATKAKLEARDDWRAMNGERDLVQLLKAIKSLMHLQVQDCSHDGLTAFESLKALFSIRQLRHEVTAENRKWFLAASEVLEHVKVSFGSKVTFDTDHTEDGVVLHLPCGRTGRFQPMSQGMYATQFLDAAALKTFVGLGACSWRPSAGATALGGYAHHRDRRREQATLYQTRGQAGRACSASPDSIALFK